MKQLILTIILMLFFNTQSIAGSGHAGGHDDHKQGHGHDNMGHGEDMDHGTHKSAAGMPAATAEATKRIKVNLTDAMKIEFSEDLTSIKSGTVIQFVVKNSGKIRHEFSIGSQEEQKAHAEMMSKMPDMVHEDGNTVTVAPGKLKFLTWRFEGKEKVVFACNIPGHYEAGMHRSINLITQ